MINTISIFAALGILISFFAIWFESKKDGFEYEGFIDLFLFSMAITFGVTWGANRLVNYLSLYKPNSFILDVESNLLVGFTFITTLFLTASMFSKKFKWSVFRILDIYSLGLNIFGIVISLSALVIYKDFTYLYLALAALAFYILVSRFRGYKYTSGFVFSAFLVFSSLVGFVSYRQRGYLLFYTILVSISIVNIYFRGKKAMINKSLTAQFIQKIKNILAKKDKDLAQVQQKLIKEDPYLKEDRDEGNSSIADEVALEDVLKTETDLHLKEIKENRDQIGDALEAIEEGEYGKCEKSSKPIDKARLEVYPEATLCKECSENREQKEEAVSKEEDI